MFYYVRVLINQNKSVTQEDVDQYFADVATKDTRDKVKTFWEVNVEEGKKRGKAEGKIEGKIEGRIESQISCIQRLLKKSYGSDAAALCEQVNKITDMTVLDDVFDLVCSPDSLENTTREIDILLSANPHATDPLKFD